MVGKYNIEVYNNRVHYQLKIQRNITIIQGDSGTGKTTLLGMIAAYERLGASSGVILHCDCPCVVLGFADWENYIRNVHGKIIFVEENMPFIKTKEFANALDHSDNYFVLIYRDSLPQLAYSIEEIYGFRENRDTQKYIKAKRVYNEMYQIHSLRQSEQFTPDCLITEDTNAGYDFFSSAFDIYCISAGGKSKITQSLKNAALQYKVIVSIVDGAAFGSDIDKYIHETKRLNVKCILFAPESFEYLILNSGIVTVKKDLLEHPYDYADSSKYSSWERFFTHELVTLTQGSIYRYSKSQLNTSYLTEGNINKIVQTLPEILK